MANRPQVTIEFKAKGQDLVKTLNKLANAQRKLNDDVSKGAAVNDKNTVASTKLNARMQKMTAVIAAQGRSWKKLGIDSKTVCLAWSGNAIDLEKLNIAMTKATVTTRVLGGSFAVARSKLLIFSFGVTILSQTVGKLIKLHGEQEAA